MKDIILKKFEFIAWYYLFIPEYFIKNVIDYWRQKVNELFDIISKKNGLIILSCLLSSLSQSI